MRRWIAVLAAMAVLSGCATTIADLRLVEGAMAVARPYTEGCSDVVIAPSVGCQWGDRCALGVGGFVGCRERGPLLEVFCWLDSRRCEALREWYPEEVMSDEGI